jgi:hypothetical protein
MARLPLELLKLPDGNDDHRETLDRFYEKLFGLCRWFRIGMNGVLYPQEPGETILDTEYVTTFLASVSMADRERIWQFAQTLEHMLRDQNLAFEGVFELIPGEDANDDWRIVKVSYSQRPFWRWYK